jgi:pimeloyl-ACP methyl ester carboxylesterase
METVSSPDGTTIAFDRTGSGPALVFVTGAFCDRQTTSSLAQVLAPDFTVYRYDRRGRGSSGDAPVYAPEREVEDLAAVAAATGEAPFVFGHSSGAVLALEAAASGAPMRKLVVYEPPYIVDDNRTRPGTDLADRVEALVAADRRSDAAKLFLAEAVEAPPEVIAMIEASPDWPGMTSIAHTLPYDLTLCSDNELPSERIARIGVPTLVLGGDNSPAWFHATVREVATTIPGAQHRFLAGQDHGAADDVLAPVLVEFLLGARTLA